MAWSNISHTRGKRPKYSGPSALVHPSYTQEGEAGGYQRPEQPGRAGAQEVPYSATRPVTWAADALAAGEVARRVALGLLTAGRRISQPDRKSDLYPQRGVRVAAGIDLSLHAGLCVWNVDELGQRALSPPSLGVQNTLAV
jgi:hypothetical protein